MSSKTSTCESVRSAIADLVGFERGAPTERLMRNIEDTLLQTFNLWSPADPAVDRWKELAVRVCESPSSPRPRLPELAMALPDEPEALDLTDLHTGVIAMYDPRCPWLLTPMALLRREVLLAHGFTGPDNVIARHVRSNKPFLAVREASGLAPKIVPMAWDSGFARDFSKEPFAAIPLPSFDTVRGGIGGLYRSEIPISACRAEWQPVAPFARWSVFDGVAGWHLHVTMGLVRPFLAYPNAGFGATGVPIYGDANVVAFDSGNPIALFRASYDGIDRHMFDESDVGVEWSEQHRTWWGCTEGCTS